MAGDDAKWWQPGRLRRALTVIFWVSIVITPFLVIANHNSGGWLISIAVAVMSRLTLILGRYGDGKNKALDAAPDFARPDPAAMRIRTGKNRWGRQRFEMKPVKAFLLTPSTSPYPEDYAAFCREFGIAAKPDGWGLVCCEDEHGHHWTGLAPDIGYVRKHAGTVAGGASFRLMEAGVQDFRPGWPEEWDDSEAGQ